MDLVTECENLSKDEVKELEVYIGQDNKTKVETRMIIYKLPDDITAKKKLSQEKTASKKGTNISEKSKSLNNVNIYITNVDSNVLPKEVIYLIYSLRWQIELMFKIWKSIFNIDKVKKVKNERLLCHLYGTLISILLSTKLVSSIKNCIYEETTQEISEHKSFKIIFMFLKDLGRLLLNTSVDIKLILKKIINMIFKNGMKSTKKGGKSPREILKLIKEKTVFDFLETS